MKLADFAYGNNNHTEFDLPILVYISDPDHQTRNFWCSTRIKDSVLPASSDIPSCILNWQIDYMCIDNVENEDGEKFSALILAHDVPYDFFDKSEFDIISESDFPKEIDEERDYDEWIGWTFNNESNPEDRSLIGIDYSFYVEHYNGKRESSCAFYAIYQDREYASTDTDTYLHYDIDFNNPNWIEDFKQYAYFACAEFYAKYVG